MAVELQGLPLRPSGRNHSGASHAQAFGSICLSACGGCNDRAGCSAITFGRFFAVERSRQPVHQPEHCGTARDSPGAAVAQQFHFVQSGSGIVRTVAYAQHHHDAGQCDDHSKVAHKSVGPAVTRGLIVIFFDVLAVRS
jgi:hypothetical protein